MILQSLHQLYDRLSDAQEYGIAPEGCSSQKVSFKIVIKEDGSLLEPQSVDPKVPTQVLGGAKPSGAGINPCFLWDNQTYLLGRQPEDKKPGFGEARFEAFKKRHLEAENQIDSPKFSAVCRFLESWAPERISNFPLLDEIGTGFGVFQIQGERGYVHDDPAILRWWNENRPKGAESERGQCLITGEDDMAIARLHPKIKGGASLVSFNDSAYDSYGKSQSNNSPVSVDAAFRYGSALNALLAGPVRSRHCIRIGDTTCVFWTEKPSLIEDCFAELFGSGSHATEEIQDEGKLDQMTRLLTAIRSGGRYEEWGDASPDTPFYLLGLAPNAARLSVRFFHRSTIDDLVSKLHEHHKCLSIARQFEKQVGKRLPDPEFPAVWQLLRETARTSDDIPPLLGGALTRAIVEGTKYPEGLYSAVIRRIHADRTITYLRAAILKAVLLRNHQIETAIMLDKSQTDPAYRLGRLFSTLEKTQEDALGELNASATPASVFPRLLRNYQHHLAKMPSGKISEKIGLDGARNAKRAREQLIQEILDPVESTGFPTQLNLKDQGRFALGYYHQRKDFFTSNADKEQHQ